MPNITSANSVLLIGVTGLFAVPQQLQGFGSDDAYEMPDVESAEVKMGVDGIMSFGWIPQIKPMNITLQADSPSMSFFEAWYTAQESNLNAFTAFGTLRQPAINRSYTLINGVLSGYSPLASGKKTLDARKFSIKWNIAQGVPTL